MVFEDARRYFWRHSEWLPPGVTWDDVEKIRPWSAFYTVPFLSILIVLIRFFFERYVALNLCLYLGIAGLPKSKKRDEGTTKEAGSGAPLTNGKTGVRFVYKSRSDDHDAKFYKATETCWRCFIYFVLFLYGSYVVVGSHWFWKHSWTQCALAQEELPANLKWYTIAELSFYVSLTITQFTDTKRKDFWQQFVHHITTIILIAGSYTISHFYVGMVIMWLHDASDYWLEAAKLAKYAKKQRTCDALFVIFALVFYISRWIYFPFYVIPAYLHDNPSLVGPSRFTWPWLFWYMCFILVVLHYYWGYLIARVAYKFIVLGKVDKDDRSDDEDDGHAED